jgi:transposase InsO family protein
MSKPFGCSECTLEIDNPHSALLLRGPGRLRDECFNENWFRSLAEARETIEAWRMDYNQCRPHSALGYRTPEEFAQTARRDCGKDGGPAALEKRCAFPTFLLPRRLRSST